MAFPLIHLWHQDFEKGGFAVTSQDLGPFPFAGGNMSRVGQCHDLAAASAVSQESQNEGRKGWVPQGLFTKHKYLDTLGLKHRKEVPRAKLKGPPCTHSSFSSIGVYS